MIHIDIIQGPDSDSLSLFQFFQNELYIGNSTGNLIIRDPELYASHLMLEVVENDLLVHPQKNVESYLIDGKRASTIRKVKRGQILTIGSTQMKIINFESTAFKSKKSLLDDKLAELVETNSPRLQTVEQLAKMMK